MTLRDKAVKIREYCEARGDCGCESCPLYDFPESGCFEVGVSSSAIERNYNVLFGEAPAGRPDYWANVCAIQKRQTEKGLSKYGQRLEENTSLSPIERLEYLEEELIDGLMYIEHIKALLLDGAAISSGEEVS